jgi:hypothetical protein
MPIRSYSGWASFSFPTPNQIVRDILKPLIPPDRIPEQLLRGAMNPRRTLIRASISIALFALVGVAAAQAQLAVYGTFAPVRISNLATGNNITGGYSTSSYWAYGVGGGVTLTAISLGPVSLGFDLRGSTRPGTQGVDTALAGIRLAGKAPLIPFKPYIQASGGYVATRATVTTGLPAGSTVSNDFAAYEILGGIDYTLIPHVDLRLIEVGGGQGMRVTGPNTNIPNISIFTINTGIVLRF